MNIVYAVISYNAYTGREMNILGWTTNEPRARALESQMNDITDSFTEEESSPLVEYHTAAIRLYGCTTEYQAYGDFDALIRDDIFHAIVPAGQGEHYRYLLEDADIVHYMNILEGLDNYLS